MGGQQSELALGMKVKHVLETLTGSKYVLKTRAQLVHPDGMSWYLHLPVENPVGWIGDACQEGEAIVFETPWVFDIANVMEFEYRSSYLNKKLRKEVGSFHDPTVRGRYRKQVPRVVEFLDSLEEHVNRLNGRYPGCFSYQNDGGLILVVFKTKASEVSKDERSLVEKLTALNETLREVEKLAAWKPPA
ncbi:MAG: hypothetical protein JRM75_04970 [Nitrososphaerota archaeon]|nr:hypothetical protein [Nitrososphaerota archaeon]